MDERIKIKVQLLDYEDKVFDPIFPAQTGKIKKIIGKAPQRMTERSIAFDLYSGETIVLPRYRVTEVHSGVKIELPKEFGAKIIVRGGFSKDNTVLYASSGLVDPDYRGEWIMPLLNLGSKTIVIEQHQRICQFYLVDHYDNVDIEEVTELSSTKRGEGGFGHTGKY